MVSTKYDLFIFCKNISVQYPVGEPRFEEHFRQSSSPTLIKNHAERNVTFLLFFFRLTQFFLEFSGPSISLSLPFVFWPFYPSSRRSSNSRVMVKVRGKANKICLWSLGTKPQGPISWAHIYPLLHIIARVWVHQVRENVENVLGKEGTFSWWEIPQDDPMKNGGYGRQSRSFSRWFSSQRKSRQKVSLTFGLSEMGSCPHYREWISWLLKRDVPCAQEVWRTKENGPE